MIPSTNPSNFSASSIDRKSAKSIGLSSGKIVIGTIKDRSEATLGFKQLEENGAMLNANV